MDDSEARGLAAAAHAGLIPQRNTLVEAHLGAVRHFATAFARLANRAGIGLSNDDLFSEGAEFMLTNVVPRYNVDGPVPFAKWVNIQLRGRMSDAMRRQVREQSRTAALPAGPSEPAGDAFGWMDLAEDLPEILAAAHERGILTQDQHTALLLMWDGESPAATAPILNCSRRQVYHFIDTGIVALEKEHACD